MGLIVIIVLAVIGAAFIAGGIVGYRKIEGAVAKTISAAAIAAGIVMWAVILLFTPVFQQTSEAPQPTVTYSTPVTDYISLIENLRATGATVEPAGELTQPFFSVTGKVIKVNGSDVQVFEYNNTVSAEAEAALISPDGSSIGTSMVGWIEPPHFYKVDKLIVLYVVGTSQDMIDMLQRVLGEQIAGR